MYKDKDKQRQAVREATRRYRQRNQGITKVSHNEGITEQSVTVSQEEMVIPVPSASKARLPRIVRGMEEVPLRRRIKPQSTNPMMVGYVPPRKE